MPAQIGAAVIWQIPIKKELTLVIGAQVTEIPGKGHCPHMQDPDAFVAAISVFLELDARA